MRLKEQVSRQLFRYIHSNHLIYNTCWEDPRLDHEALNLNRESRLMVITSAGCNALDYLLRSPKQIYAIDLNPKQNALLELKIAGIKTLAYEDFFSIFGTGKLGASADLYWQKMRSELSDPARVYWDKAIKLFQGRKKTFYYRGTTGYFANLVKSYVKYLTPLEPVLNDFVAERSHSHQRELYYSQIKPHFWSKLLKQLMKREGTLALLGVPKAQLQQVEREYSGGIVKFIEDSIDAVFGELPFQDNYFWRLYLVGSYTPECCPEYLKRENFSTLKQLVDRVTVYTGSITDFLQNTQAQLSHFVLLDHMDWLANVAPQALQAEWQQIVNHATPNAKFLWRSGAINVDYVDPINVKYQGNDTRLGSILKYDTELSSRLHKFDRVHTYGSFSVASLVH
jgi:S-adenosylmethionine-diacylglycerol 3-amino-3-carboxypropyl transferase